MGPRLDIARSAMGFSRERTPVEADQEPYLRLYRRLWLSRIDLEEARAAINEIIVRKLPYPRSRGPSPLLQALTTSLVVSYARPFVNTRGQSSVAERTVPGSLLRVFSSSERAFHDRLMDMRNREAAHTDADTIDVSIEIFPDGDGGVCRVSRNPLRRFELRALVGMIEKLEGEIEHRCEELRGLLPQHVWL
jgi:hypothetical protein